MNFALSQHFWLFILVPAAALLGLFRARAHRRRLENLIDASLLPAICEPAERLRRRLRRSGFILTLTTLLLVTALLRPQWGFEWRESRKKGGDIVLAVDVSDSMLANDIAPTRLERAKHKITDLLGMLRGDRVALVAFSGVAFIESPLTLDYGAFRQFLSLLEPGLIPVKGSNIEGALKKSLEALGIKEGDAGGERKGSAIILLTDGEELEGDLASIGETARANGVRIYVMGIGSPEGAPIPAPGGGYKKAKSGKVVITRLRPDVLEEIALSTGGTYVQSISSSKDIETVYNEGMRQSLGESEQTMGNAKRWHEYYQVPLGAALLLLALVHWGRFIGGKKGAAAAALFVIVGMPPAAKAEDPEKLGADAKRAFEKGDFARAEKKFEAARALEKSDPRFTLGVGASKYRQGKFDEAQAIYAGAVSGAQLPKDKAAALYNLGNSFVQSGRYKEAITAYEQTLKLTPEDREAADNLAYAKRKLEEQKKEEEKQNEEEKKQEEKKSEQDKEQQQKQQEQDQEKEQEKNQENQPQQNDEQQEQDRPEPDQQQQSEEKSEEKQDEQGEKPQPTPAEDAKDDKSSESSSSAESQKTQEAGSPGSEKPEQKNKELDMLLQSVQEKQDARNRYRLQQALKALKAEKRQLPEKDW